MMVDDVEIKTIFGWPESYLNLNLAPRFLWEKWMSQLGVAPTLPTKTNLGRDG